MFPTVANACPYCMSNAGDGYTTATVLMLLVPAALVGGLYVWLRDLAQQHERNDSEVI